MAAHKVEKNRWSQYLAPQLSGIEHSWHLQQRVRATAALSRRPCWQDMTSTKNPLMNVQQKWMKGCMYTVDEVNWEGAIQAIISLAAADPGFLEGGV